MVDPKEFALQAVEVLNRALGEDHEAIAELFNKRVPCNEALAKDSTIQVLQHRSDSYVRDMLFNGYDAGGYTLGVLGLINGIIGIQPDGWGYLCAIYNIDCPNDGPIEGFLTEEQAKGLTTKDKCPTCGDRLEVGELIRFEVE